MGKLLEKLDKVSQTSNAGIGFLGGRPSGHAPRPIGLLASVKVTDVSAVSAAVKNGVDGIIALGWKSGASLADLKTAAGDAALGVELPADAGAGALKEAQDAGADFVLAPSALRARALLDEVEKLDVVLELDLPRDDMEVLLLRGQSLAPAQLGLLNTGLGATEVNLVRVALQGLGAVLGGTQSLHTNAFDEAIALPTAKAARLALRTQQVIAYESDVTKTVDPFAGSYVMESLTDDLEAAILELMATVEAKGGAVAAIEEGFQKSEIERSAYAVNQQIDSGERTVVGLNRFRLDEEDAYEPLRVDPQIEADQRERLASLRSTRDNGAVDRALDELRAVAKGSGSGPDNSKTNRTK